MALHSPIRKAISAAKKEKKRYVRMWTVKRRPACSIVTPRERTGGEGGRKGGRGGRRGSND